MNVNDKRSQIFELCFLPINHAEIMNRPGCNSIQVIGQWTNVRVSSGEWKETMERSGKPVEQELKAIVTDSSADKENQLHELFSQDGLLLLKLTNGEMKVIGSDEFPVRVFIERDGNPAKISLSLKRSSPEPAKILTSF